MADLKNEIRANIARVEGEIEEIRRAAKKHLADSESVLKTQIELRAHMIRLDDLRHNLADAEIQSDTPSIIPAT